MKKKIRGALMPMIVAGLCCLQGCGKPAEEEPQWNITEETIEIPGISESGTLLFLTDTHVVIRDETDSQQEAENGAQRYPQFHTSNGISSAELFSQWVDYANEEEVDGVLLGGDMIDYPTEGNIDFLTGELGRLEMPYLYTMGNHDWTFPWAYMDQKGKDTYRPMLEPLMQDNTVIHTMDMGEYTVVAVDNSTNQIDPAALEEYEDVLQEGKPVITLLHVPFMTQTLLTEVKKVWSSGVVIGAGNYGGIYPSESSQAFLDMTTAADSPVVAVLAGHVHLYNRSYLEGQKKVLQIVGDAGYKGSAILLRVKPSMNNSLEGEQ